MRISYLLAIAVFILMSCQPSPESQSDAQSYGTNYVRNRAPLYDKPYLGLPLGTIKAKGWLLTQLERQRDGLTGKMDEVYAEVVGPRNGWLGGDGDGWERGPYWIDGLLPLAYILDDQTLKDKVQPWIEWSLQSQTEEGYFGPVPFEVEPEPEAGLQKSRRKDWWPKMVMLKILMQYYTATEDARVIDLLTKYFRYQLNELPQTPIDHWSLWGNRRVADNMMVVYWLYNITGDSFLLELTELMQEQAFPWERLFLNEDCYEQQHDPWHYSRVMKRYPYDEEQLDNLCLKQMGGFHTVNLAQGIKKPIIYYQQQPDELYIRAVKQAFKDLKKYHGQAQGMYGGDEPLHGNSPNQGVELCSVVELMFSLEQMMAITGDVQFMDHLEKLAFNALPTQISDDFNTRQYMQSANQVEISRKPRNFYEDVSHKGTDICFGTLTGYPCCTCNMHQGWPKFTQSLWHASTDNGLAALSYAPSSVTAKVADGVEVRLEEDTQYPFEDTIRLKISTAQSVDFPLHLRIPAWCEEATLLLNGKLLREEEGNQLIQVKREWKDGDVLTLIFPSKITVNRWVDYSVALEKGPLVYALKLEGERKLVRNEDHYGDYYSVMPKANWNFALIEQYLQDIPNQFTVSHHPTEAYPWNLENAPIRIKTTAVQMKDWTVYNGMPGPMPWSPRRQEKEEWEFSKIELIPYGCTNLRITEFPTVWFNNL
ncbi:MAG: beta-L-arabinofuranosidase domain-containing protein [Bacteroidota bacterium]